MPLLHQMLAAAGIAFAVAVLLCLLSDLLPWDLPRQAAAAAAVALAYAAGHIFTTGWTPLPPVDTTNWLPCFALAAAGVGSVVTLFAARTVRIVVAALVSFGAQRLLLEPKFRYGWSPHEGWLWVVCFGCAVVTVTMCLVLIARRACHPAEPSVILLIVCVAASGALTLSGSFLLGQFAAVLAATTLGSLVFSLRGRVALEAVAGVSSLLLIALLASGYFFADLPFLSMLLLAGAPACALIPKKIIAPRWAAAARVAVVFVIGSMGVLVALRSSPTWTE